MENYKDMFANINKIVLDVDPINLGGVPGEYDNQVNEIIKLINTKKSYKLQSDEIYKIFYRSFADSITDDKSSFDAIATKIANLEQSS